MCCAKCSTVGGAFLLLIGIAYVLKDLGVWTAWNISLWTTLTLLAGIAMVGMGCCKACKDCCGTCEPKKTKKK